ncbi:lipocalin family protein [Corynebacterium gerontici]|uniref:Outer membrane lipoprotein Blc n=1 Tax=Corynebacterium gerontici TaxID=2079234 RepID=A0A3G6J591_9CORY|nr:lipocalin family protein [Corynebacterium gerontici]AZA12098.1 Outer membrane lipoprotein Blc precursor [Corynebacterium gerontici]
MRVSLHRRIAAVALGLACAAGISAQPANAQDLFDGGRIAGGSSQIVPRGLSSSNELSEVNKAVDLDRYAGKWYQVAAVPQPYTLQCYRDTTAEYAVTAPGEISVKNSCVTPWGTPSGIEGTATVRGQASLRVNFPDVPFQDPNGPANYRITYLADDYSLAIVGDPDRLSGFVLSRTPQLSQEQWDLVKHTVDERGWLPCTFLTVPAQGGMEQIKPVCTL